MLIVNFTGLISISSFLKLKTSFYWVLKKILLKIHSIKYEIVCWCTRYQWIDELRMYLSVDSNLRRNNYTRHCRTRLYFQWICTRLLYINFGYISLSLVKYSNTASFTIKLNYKHWLFKLFCSLRNESKKSNRPLFYIFFIKTAN